MLRVVLFVFRRVEKHAERATEGRTLLNAADDAHVWSGCLAVARLIHMLLFRESLLAQDLGRSSQDRFEESVGKPTRN